MLLADSLILRLLLPFLHRLLLLLFPAISSLVLHGDLLGRSSFNLDTTLRIHFDLRLNIIQFIQLICIEFGLYVIFEFDGCLQYFNQLRDIDVEVLDRQYLIDVQLGLSAEFLGYHLFHEPVFREYFNVFFFVFLQSSLEP